VLGSARKLGSDISQIWPNTTEENQNKKSKKDVQWLRIYSQSIELARGDDDIKTLFFPMALETMPLEWFDKLNLGSIRNWEDF